jgi:hypothetical protein
MGDADALAASGSDWEGPLLAAAAERDPYAVVRYVARRSQRAVERALPKKSAVGLDVRQDDITALEGSRDDRDVTVAE